MLCQFSVKNYKSIRDEITLNMEALDIDEHRETLIEMNDGESYLPLAVIYGANGSGKSNVLEAMSVLISKIVRPVEVMADKEEISYCRKLLAVPFAFTEDTKKSPTEFELFFHTDLAEYRYQLHLMKDVVMYESLSRRKCNTEEEDIETLFERSCDGKIILASDLKRLEISAEISETLPLLSYLGFTYRKNTVVNDIFKWLENKVRFCNEGKLPHALRMMRDEKIKQLVLQMMNEIDIDIVDFWVEEKGNSFEVYVTHVVDEIKVELMLQDESSGVQKIFEMLPFVVRSLADGEVLVVDELDVRMHPVLLRYIIQLYSDKNSNPHGTQLIFTSNELSTMSEEVFRRDEIWFVAKGKLQETKLYSLVEFKVLDDEGMLDKGKYNQKYLEGKYGAVPCVGRL